MTAGHTTPLIPEQRQAKLLQLLRDEGIVGTRILTDYLGVSHMTVRRDIAALEMERIVTGAEGVLQTLALAPPIRAFEAPACSAYLAEVVNRLPQLSGLAVADREGRVRCAAGLSFGAEGVASAAWFAEAMTKGAFVVGR